MIRYHENAINRVSKSQASVDEAFQVGHRARDGDLRVIKKQGDADATCESVRLHELTVSPGIFHIVVFTSDMLLCTKKSPPGTLIKGVEVTNARDLSNEIETHLKSWRSKWVYKPWKFFAKTGTTIAPPPETSEAVFMVHVVASNSGGEDHSHHSAESDIDVLVDKKVGEGKIYLDHQGALHQKYGVTAKHGPGTIVIVRPDGHIGYRVLGTAKSAWDEVDQYFESILLVN